MEQFNYEKAAILLYQANNAKVRNDTVIEATILMELSKLIKDYNNGTRE